MRIYDTIKSAPQQADCLLDKFHNKWNRIHGKEGVKTQDAGGGRISRRRDRDGEYRFYFAILEFLSSTAIVDEILGLWFDSDDKDIVKSRMRGSDESMLNSMYDAHRQQQEHETSEELQIN